MEVVVFVLVVVPVDVLVVLVEVVLVVVVRVVVVLVVVWGQMPTSDPARPLPPKASATACGRLRPASRS